MNGGMDKNMDMDMDSVVAESRNRLRSMIMGPRGRLKGDEVSKFISLSLIFSKL